ncbi:MAG TPA: prenyltransferase/squalene oxidase repeat-containing protein [Ktedonobacterales bacterium]|jgi:hypothetical protein
MNAVARAGRFLEQHGRDIDRARFAYHFGTTSQEELLAVLSRYQNADGGFARLEVDIKAPESNPFATELALVICAQAEVAGEHLLLQRAAAYLEATQDEEGGWRFTPEIYQHELAPWFQGWEWPNLNPACTLAGVLKQLSLGSERLHAGVERLFEQRANVKDVALGEFYDVRPYAGYFSPEWAHPQRDLYLSGVLWWLIRQQLEGKLPDAGHFFEYVRSQETYLGRHLPAAMLTEQLDRLAAEQQEDGGWPSPYNEGWRGWVTVQSLLVLQQFGRL